MWQEKKWIHGVYPISYALKYLISYYDRRGSRFDAIQRPKRIAFRPNRFDLMDISMVSEADTDILLVRLKEVGETVIKVSQN